MILSNVIADITILRRSFERELMLGTFFSILLLFERARERNSCTKNVPLCILKETSRKSDDEGGPRSPSDVYSSDDDKVEHSLM